MGLSFNIQDVANDVRSTGILVFDQSKSGSLRFAHKSFLEYLLAKVYAEYVQRQNREVSTALVAATKLGAHHILANEESIAFFAEVLIGSLEDAEAQELALSGAGSKLLFNMIVIQQLGGGLIAKTRARLSVMELMRKARRIQLLR